MPDISALAKFPCAACGAQAQWNPAKQLLVCPFCGIVGAVHAGRGDRRDRGARPRQGAARAARRGARLAGREADGPVPELQGRDGVRPRAGRPELRVLRLAGARRLHGDQGADPAAELAAVHGQPDTRSASRSASWYASKWLAPDKLKSRALVDRIHGVYIPYWTFDAHVVCPWSADAGHYYYTTETYREGGRTGTRQVRHVRWVPAAGEVQHFFDDEPVPGTQRHVACRCWRRSNRFRRRTCALRHGVSLGLRRRALPGRALRRRQAVGGGDERQADRDVRRRRFPATPTATCRSSRPTPDQTFKHILVPVWLLTYNFGAKAFQVVVNGVHRTDGGRLSEELLEDRAAGAPRDHRDLRVRDDRAGIDLKEGSGLRQNLGPPAPRSCLSPEP